MTSSRNRCCVGCNRYPASSRCIRYLLNGTCSAEHTFPNYCFGEMTLGNISSQSLKILKNSNNSIKKTVLRKFLETA